jgi:hypothetical protein
MQTTKRTSVIDYRKQAVAQIAIYKAISIVSARLVEKLAWLEQHPIHIKGGRTLYEQNVRT